MSDLVASSLGAYTLSLIIGVGVGLVVQSRSRRVRVGGMLIVAVYAIQTATFQPDAVWAVPLFICTLGFTGVVTSVIHYSDSPLLAGEPIWRKVALVLVHGRQVRAAAER